MPGKKKTTAHLPRNYELTPGVMRFSKARMYAKRGIWAKKPFKAVKKQDAVKPKFVTKKVGGDKNGKERKVFTDKGPKLLGEFRTHKRAEHRAGHAKKAMRLRPTITPGTVLIILAGRHKGKRVVFVKQLEKSGLLLVTGPMKLNSCPLRRIAQAYVMATKTHVDISGVNVPTHLDDAYFRRASAKKQPKKENEADLFATGKSEYVVSDQRKADQKQVDQAILAAIKKHPERHVLFGYLGSRFSIGKNQYPHKMIF